MKLVEICSLMVRNIIKANVKTCPNIDIGIYRLIHNKIRIHILI